MAVKKEPLLLKWLPLCVVCFSGLMGIVTYTSWVTSNVARIPYVEDLFSKQTKYMEDKLANVRLEAFSHSDINRAEVTSEQKGLSVKLDMLILMMTQQQQQAQAYAHRVKP